MRSEFPAMRFSPAMLLSSRPRNCARVADNFLNTTDRGVASSNPAFANQSVHFAYVLEKAETPREMWRFRPLRTGKIGPPRFCPSRRAFSPCKIKTVRFSAGMSSGQHSLNYRLSATVLWYSCELRTRGAKSDSMAQMIYERFLAEPAYVFIEKPNAIGAEL
jgi:hypothetical protein